MIGRAVVILAYALTLLLVVWPPRRFALEDRAVDPHVPFWRNVRFWASLVIAAQIAVYAYWG